jgi:hypothetical protein
VTDRNTEKRMLTAREVAERYSIDVGTLANWRSQKRGPRYYVVGRKKILYLISETDSFFLSHPVRTVDSETS